MATKGFLRTNGHDYLVGAEDLSDKEYPYHGPVARVSSDNQWLHIITDDYEGAAMLNIEALPYLRRALSKIAKSMRASRLEEMIVRAERASKAVRECGDRPPEDRP